MFQIAEKIILENRVKKEPDSPSRQASIVLNATSEFCRALGDIPTYGQAGNREEIEKDELAVSNLYVLPGHKVIKKKSCSAELEFFPAHEC